MDADAAVVAAHVEEYLKLHPRAADTLAGIAAWWIPGGVWIRREAVQQALNALVAGGVLQTRRLPSGQLLYSARRPTDNDDGMGSTS